jgi:tetratricopeptide (TPR) repeat protein
MKTNHHYIGTITIIAVFMLFACTGYGQIAKTPAAGGNKKASVSERIGITDVLIHYDRPGVKGREDKIWGNVVHYGFADLDYGTSKAAPWRAGANENTTMEFSTDVKIEGKELAAGKYGFFIAMGPEVATLIFSKDNNAWGSFYYDPKDDALRVDVPVKKMNQSIEWLKYEFEGQTDNSAVLSLLWEKVKIPFTISVDLQQTQLEEYRHQFYNGTFYRYWQNMHQAANFCLVNNINLEEGLSWADQSIHTFFGEANFLTLTTYAGLLEKAGRKHESDSLMKKALPMGSLLQVNSYGRTLLRLKKYQEAFAIYKMNYEKYPGDIYTNLGMIKGYAALGNKPEALKFVDKAITLAPDQNTKAYLDKMKEMVRDGKDVTNY